MKLPWTWDQRTLPLKLGEIRSGLQGRKWAGHAGRSWGREGGGGRVKPGAEREGGRVKPPATTELSGTDCTGGLSLDTQRQHPQLHWPWWSLWTANFSWTNTPECRPCWESQNPSLPSPTPTLALRFDPSGIAIFHFSKKNHQPKTGNRIDRPPSQFYLNFLPKLPRQIFQETILGWNGRVIHFIYHLNALECWDRFIQVAAS